MRENYSKQREISLTESVEKLDFADNIVLLTHRLQDIQDKTNDIAIIDKKIGLTKKDKSGRESQHTQHRCGGSKGFHIYGITVDGD